MPRFQAWFADLNDEFNRVVEPEFSPENFSCCDNDRLPIIFLWFVDVDEHINLINMCGSDPLINRQLSISDASERANRIRQNFAIDYHCIPFVVAANSVK